MACVAAAVFFKVTLVCLPPEVGKAIEGEARQPEQVLTCPHRRQLHWYAAVSLAYGLVKGFQVERVAIGLVVQEIVDTKEPRVVYGVAACYATVIFYL